MAWTTCAAVLGGMALALPEGAVAAKSKRPNIVMVVTDDQTLSQYDQRTMPKTRRLLGNRGTTFTEAVVTTPLCCPSRATMITGQYGHNNGVLRNTYRDLKGKDNTLPVWLRRAGYKTLHVGKYMNQYADAVEPDTEVAPGWDEWHSVIAPRYYDYELMVNGASESFGGAPEDYLGRVLTERSTSLIDSYAPRRKPFYLQLDHFAPHISVNEGEGRCAHGAVPDALDADRFTAEPLPQPPSFDEEDVSDKPSFVQELPRLSPATVADLQRLHGCALASLASVDRSVDAVFDAVKSAGELDRTVFIFVSDNGAFAGEHRIPGSKQNPYEEAVRVPLGVRAPKAVLGGEAPGKVRRPVANIDLAPTILDLAGGEPCGKRGECRRMDGRSLVPLLEGRRGGWPRGRALVLELDRGRSPGGGDGRACDYTGVRTTEAVWVEHHAAIDPATGDCVPLAAGVEYELYDLADDPFQLESLAAGGAAPTGVGLFDELSRRSEKLRDCAGIRGRDPRPRGGRTWCE